MTYHAPSYTNGVKICVIGVGCAGGNVLEPLVAHQDELRLNLLAIDTNVAVLARRSMRTLLLESAEGEADHPEIGREAAEASWAHIAAALSGSDLVFIVASLDGGMAAGAAPVVADIAREAGALCIALTSSPFETVSESRMFLGRSGLLQLGSCADALYHYCDEDFVRHHSAPAWQDARRRVSERFITFIRGVTLLYRSPGMISMDTEDLREVFGQAGAVVFGVGSARGPERAVLAMEDALGEAGLPTALASAGCILIVARASMDMNSGEWTQLEERIRNRASVHAQVFVGAVIDRSLTDELVVTVIATHLDHEKLRIPPAGISPSLYDIESRWRVAEPRVSYAGAKPIYLLAPDTLAHPQIAQVVGHLSALYRSVGGDELIVNHITHVPEDRVPVASKLRLAG